MKIGIMVAMDSEYALLSEALKGRDVCLVRSGIGKVNAALAAVSLIRDHAPDFILSTGVAGGIDSCLEVMDIVVSREVMYHDVWCGSPNEPGQVQGLPARFSANAALYEAALKSAASAKGGLMVSGDRFVEDPAENAAIKKAFPEALSVDMESAAIAQVCHVMGVPFVAMRVISDVPGNDHSRVYEDFWGEVSASSFRAVLEFLDNIPEKL